MPKNRSSDHNSQESKPRNSTRLSLEIALPQAAIVAISSFLIGAGAVSTVTHVEQRQTQSVEQNQSIQQQCQQAQLTPPQVQQPQQSSMSRREAKD